MERIGGRRHEVTHDCVGVDEDVVWTTDLMDVRGLSQHHQRLLRYIGLPLERLGGGAVPPDAGSSTSSSPPIG